MDAMSIATGADGKVLVAGDQIVTVTVLADVDGLAGSMLLAAVRSAAGGRSLRVELDLRSVTGFDDDGVAMLGRCLLEGRRLRDGIGVQVASEPGRRAFLAALSEV
jgi:hypothetical protein